MNKTRNLKILAATVVFLLLIPFTAMQFTDEVSWGFFDFTIMGALLFGTGLLSEVVWRKVGNTRYRAMLILAIIGTFMLVWAELAVGIPGTPLAGN